MTGGGMKIFAEYGGECIVKKSPISAPKDQMINAMTVFLMEQNHTNTCFSLSHPTLQGWHGQFEHG